MSDTSKTTRKQYVKAPPVSSGDTLSKESVSVSARDTAVLSASLDRKGKAPASSVPLLTPEQRKESERMFGGIEYCLDRYFDANLDRKVQNAYKDFQKKQGQEFSRRFDAAGTVFSSANPAAAHAYARQGELTGKQVSDIISDIYHRMLSDKRFKEDVTTLSQNWRQLYVATYGKEQYVRMCKSIGGVDLADYYVGMRISDRILQRMAAMDMPKSALEYALRNGMSNSLVGLLQNLSNVKGDQKADIKDAMMKHYYDAGFGTKLLTSAVSFTMDAATTGGYSFAGGTLAKLFSSGAVALDASFQGKEAFNDGGDTLKVHEKAVSKLIFGNENDAARYRKSSKRIDTSSNEFIHLLNDDLNNKVKLKPLVVRNTFDVATQKAASVELSRALGDDGGAAYDTALAVSREYDLPVTIGTSVPQWMLNRSEKANINSASSFLAIAVEMKQKGMKSHSMNGKTMSFEEVCQRAVDYSRAAAVLHERKESVRRSSEESHSEEPSQRPAETTPTPSVMSQQQQEQQQQAQKEQLQQSDQQQDMDFSNWGSFLQDTGLGGLSQLTGNLGYTIAMLPDVLMGLFTGRNKRLTVDNSLGALAALVGGMFINGRKHPMLKMLLMGFGGLSMLSKASEEINGVGTSNPQRTYQKIADEPLNARISHPVMKGNTLLADIDGVPVVITVSGHSVDAFYKGALPLNTLANNILRTYDEQGGFDSILAANRSLEMSEVAERSRGLR